MNEIFDNLLTKILLTVVLCIIIYFYRYIHAYLYPSSRVQLLKRFYPSQNSASTIHLFSRIFGMALILSGISLDVSQGIIYPILHIFIMGPTAIILYLASIYILESIALYKFEYNDEIVKRKSIPYAIISFSQSLGLAMLLKVILLKAQHSIVLLLFLWLFAVVIVGFSTRIYRFISKLSFNKLLIQKNYALSFSYSGFFLGLTILIISSFSQAIPLRKENYIVQVLLKITLSAIIFPLFQKGIIWSFRIKDPITSPPKGSSNSDDLYDNPEPGVGIYEGVLFLSAAYLTSVIIEKVRFGNFFPIS